VAETWEIDEDLLSRATPEELHDYLRALQTIARSWREQARAEQLPPETPWRVWYVRGGRGSGKTRTGAETLAEMMRTSDVGGWGVVAPTYADARDTCIEGPSGLLAAFGTTRQEVDAGRSEFVKGWNRSIGEMYMRSGSMVWIDGADDGADRVQGKNLRGCWCDEVGLWKLGASDRSRKRGRIAKTTAEHAWDESIRFAVRLSPARIVVTGTPKQGHPLVKKLMADPRVVKTRLRMRDNIDNLDAALVNELLHDYEGTRLGRQELDGDVLEEVDGALWVLTVIDELRVRIDNVPPLERIVVAVDPAVTSAETSDETGIVVAGRAGDHAYVLADGSGRFTPAVWAGKVVDLYYSHEADRVVPEVNNGGDLVAFTIHTIDPRVPVKPVHAKRGKALRADPVSVLYEQGRVHHVGGLGLLEDQMTSWVPGQTGDSPDRVDALVYAITELLVDGGAQYAGVAEVW
jgi:phage terminase large subunit-like protein